MSKIKIAKEDHFHTYEREKTLLKLFGILENVDCFDR